MNKARIKRYSAAVLKFSIAFVLVWYLFKSGRLTKESFVKLIEPYSLPFIVLSVFAFIASQMLSSVRIVFLLRIIEVPLKFLQAFRLTMIGNFFNMVIPGMVGGDIVKGFQLAKGEESCKGRSSGIVIVDRVIGLLALLIIGGVSIIYVSQLDSPVLSRYRSELHNIIVLTAAVLFLFALFIFFGKNKLVRERLKGLALRIFRGGFFYYMVEGLGAVTKKRRYLLYASLVSIVIQVISLGGVLILLKVTGEKTPDVVALMAVSSIVMLLGVIPVTPGNIGWTEFLATYGWSAVGSDKGAEVFIYWRIVTLLCSLPWGIYYLLRPDKKAHPGI